MLFYYPGLLSVDAIIRLGEEESRHIGRVLRLKEGDALQLTDGNGRMAEASLVSNGKKYCELAVSRVNDIPPEAFPVHVALAPTKSAERYEWFLEKAVELGVGEVTPLLCEHSERRTVKEERSLNIMVSAMKQSGRAWLPALNPMASFSSFISSAVCLRKYIAWCGTGREQHLTEIHGSPAPAIIMIGPEGDFSDHEVVMAKKNGFLPINLGPNRLRTETAGLAACLLLTTINNRPPKL